MDDRLCLQGILYVLYNDVAWQLLPPKLGFGSGQTCWRRLERRQQAGVFDQLHRILLSELNAAGELDWSRACVDGSHIRAKKGSADTGPSPVDRRKTGSKHHLIRDGRGTPLKAITHHRGQRQRRHPDPRPGRRHPARRRPPRPFSQASRSPARQQGIRFHPQPRPAPQAPDPARHLPHGCPEHSGHGQAPLRRGADLRLAPPLQVPRRPPGTPHRTPRRLPVHGLQPYVMDDHVIISEGQDQSGELPVR
ncbi:transposase [Streptomyces sp. RM72]|nr:transposase [Streptomyces sp. RM72]